LSQKWEGNIADQVKGVGYGYNKLPNSFMNIIQLFIASNLESACDKKLT